MELLKFSGQLLLPASYLCEYRPSVLEHPHSPLCWCVPCWGYGTLRRLEPPARFMGRAHHFGLTLVPEPQASEQSGKLDSEMRFTMFGAQPLLLQMCFWKETQTLKYLSVRGEEPWDPKCFQPWGKGPEEPVFLHLKKGARASLNTGAGNASADGDEIIPRGAVFLLLKKPSSSHLWAWSSGYLADA